MSEVTKEDFEATIKNQARRIEMLEYETNILRAQLKEVHGIIVEALQGKEMRDPRREKVYADDDHRTDDT